MLRYETQQKWWTGGGKNLPFSYLFFVSVSLCWGVLCHARWGGVPWMDSVGMVRLSTSVITV